MHKIKNLIVFCLIAIVQSSNCSINTNQDSFTTATRNIAQHLIKSIKNNNQITEQFLQEELVLSLRKNGVKGYFTLIDTFQNHCYTTLAGAGFVTFSSGYLAFRICKLSYKAYKKKSKK